MIPARGTAPDIHRLTPVSGRMAHPTANDPVPGASTSARPAALGRGQRESPALGAERARPLSLAVGGDVAVAGPALQDAAPALAVEGRPTLVGHLRIARVDHWVKNVFVLPGVAAALALAGVPVTPGLAVRVAVGLLIVGLVASSNYTINEVLDAPYDRRHPKKRFRPVPSGRVHVPLAYVQWIALGAVGVGAAALVGGAFAWTMALLWGMGCVYNIPPVRSKDVPYLDVLSEAVNNPLRMAAGWFLVVDDLLPPATLLLAYWMVGCYFMGIKRLNEVRELGGSGMLADYRRSLAALSAEQVLIAVTFYGSTAMLFFGAFLMRYRLELVLSFPAVALVMAAYLELGFRGTGAAQNPEKLYREPRLMLAVAACVVLIGVLLFVDLPGLHRLVDPGAIGPMRTLPR